jgi:GTPase
MHKAGFVNIIGYPNTGKSTLMNALLGERLSIINAKAQTTRHRIMGFLNEENCQIVFSDTPGIIDPKYKLQEGMMGFVKTALEDADVFLLVLAADEKDERHADLIAKVRDKGIPVVAVLNKIDLISQEELERKAVWIKEQMPGCIAMPVSALHGFNIQTVLETIKELLPEHPAYFDKEALSDKTLRFFASEIIREKLLDFYSQEVPYSCEVVIEEFKEEEGLTRIRALIYVNRDSQKAIIIGHKGLALKRVGISARKAMEKFLGTKVHLETYVKVAKDWRDNEQMLRNLGYLD